jgi:hypothetical protein
MPETEGQRIDVLQAQVMQLQIDQLKSQSVDFERRLRVVEEVAIKFNFILYLTMGGGLLALINLAGVIVLIVRSANP